MRDPYLVLGVAKDADADTIKSAYRALAKTCHPDRNPGDARAEARFKEASAAYEFLSDTTQRRRFDRGEIDAAGQPRFGAGFGAAGFGQGARGQRPGGFGAGQQGGGIDLDEILGGLFRRQGAGGGAPPPPPSADEVTLDMAFLDAAKGVKRRLARPDGRDVELTVPPGSRDGQVLRLRGRARSGGDLLVRLAVQPDQRWRLDGDQAQVDQPVPFIDAVLGGHVAVETLDGTVRLRVPAGSDSGRVLRVRGKGWTKADGSRGDLHVRLLVALTPVPDAELKALLRDWALRQGHLVAAADE